MAGVRSTPVADHSPAMAPTRERSSDKGTIAIGFVQEALVDVTRRGLDAHALLAAAGISPELLNAPQARVSSAHYGRLWHLIAEATDDEFFGMDCHPMKAASFTLERGEKKYLGMLSAEGGVEIEAVAEANPDAIAKIWIDPVDGLDEATAREWVKAANLNPDAENGAVDILLKLYRAYTEGDADLCEINPLILKPTGEVHALDAKVTLDANADYRHEWAEYEATQVRDVREQAAHEKGLQYVGLDGTVGIIANGAGLAMSTLDVVNQAGGKPANFLDVGGGADADKFVAALTILDNDPRVKSIFINIFGGITRGEEVANGIIEAAGRIDLSHPMVIRLDGTNADEGRELLKPHLSDKLQMEPTMLSAAAKAVELAASA